ncbi:MAG: RCC1 domain-containing protein [Gemmatimonadales bacterium]
MHPQSSARPGLLVAVVALVVACRTDSGSPVDPSTDPISTAAAAAATAPVFWQLAMSGYRTCGVATDGSAWCWGGGSLADGSDNSSLTPVRVAGGPVFRQISVDFMQTCAVADDHRAYCWDSSEPLAPAPVPGLLFYQVDVGFQHRCGVSYPDRLGYCWGENSSGQLGDGTLIGREHPTLVGGGLRFQAISAGSDFTCGLATDGRAYCWGADNFGQLGDGSTVTPRKRPSPVAGGLEFRQLDVGSVHTCAVTVDYQAYCWGYGRSGQLGDGKTLLRFTPRAVMTKVRFRRVAAGSGFSCAETPTSQTYCWGDNEFGQVGDGTTIRRLTPVPVAGGLRFAQVGAGGWNACGKTSAGVGYCWGENDGGELGDGTTTDRYVPTLIAAPVSADGATITSAAIPTRSHQLADSLARR